MLFTVTFTGTSEEVLRLLTAAKTPIDFGTAGEAVFDHPDSLRPMPIAVKPEVEETKAPAEEKPKRHRRTKAEMEAEAKLAAPAEEKSDVDLSDLGDDEPAVETSPAKAKLTLEGDIIPAFQAYAKKHTREAAGGVLKDLGVKAVRDIATADYPKVLRILRS